ncbi:MAG TPA: DUF433 domain-containing protein [Thermoanaerobaculia bacterium]|nr:DUF433 domain-containing protein [Thermoanaerobaculia bacterium]
MSDRDLMERITYNPQIFGGKAIIRGHRLAVDHVLGMMAAGSSIDELLEHYPWLEREDIQACLLYASCVIGREYFSPALVTSEAAD